MDALGTVLNAEGRRFISGSGIFASDRGRQAFGPGDFLFAPAGMEHRFEDFSHDFATWVLFYGPEGGEQTGR